MSAYGNVLSAYVNVSPALKLWIPTTGIGYRMCVFISFLRVEGNCIKVLLMIIDRAVSEIMAAHIRVYASDFITACNAKSTRQR